MATRSRYIGSAAERLEQDLKVAPVLAQTSITIAVLALVREVRDAATALASPTSEPGQRLARLRYLDSEDDL